jgi:hypothetical protein
MDWIRIARSLVVPALLASILAAPGAGGVLAQDASPIATIEGSPVTVEASPVVTAMPPVPDGAEVVVAGLDNPRHLVFGRTAPSTSRRPAPAGEGPCVEGPEGDRECYGRSSAITRVDPDHRRP